jgi:hypothetical protein
MSNKARKQKQQVTRHKQQGTRVRGVTNKVQKQEQKATRQ